MPVDNSVHVPVRRDRSPLELVETPTSSRPGRSCTSAPGLADQKDTDRLMTIMPSCPRGGQT